MIVRLKQKRERLILIDDSVASERLNCFMEMEQSSEIQNLKQIRLISSKHISKEQSIRNIPSGYHSKAQRYWVKAIDLIGQPGHQEANGPNGENVGGIRLYDSELTSSNGKLKLTGIGGTVDLELS